MRDVEKKREYMREYQREYMRKRRAEGNIDKDAQRRWSMKSNYGITGEQFEDMLCEQDGCCAICGRKFNREAGQKLTPHVDHCHNSGSVRGLVCKRCNTVLGHLEQVSVSKYINYLERCSNAHPSNEIGLYLLRKAS